MHSVKKVLQILVLSACGTAVAWWLFADTVRHHLGRSDHLRISFWGGYHEYEMWKEILAAFEERYPGIQVKPEYITDRYDAKIQQQLVSDSAPDVFVFQDEPFPPFCASEKFQDLSDYVNRSGDGIDLDRYWPTAVESFLWEGRPYGIPIWGGDNLIFYNKEAFRRAGVAYPDDETWTFDDFAEICRKLTLDLDGDGRTDQFGISLPGWIYYLPWIWGHGARILDARKRWAFTGPEAVASLQYYYDLCYRWKVSPSPWEMTIGRDVAFLTGRVAMFCSGPWSMPFLNETALDYDVAHIPIGPAGRHTRVTWDALVMFSGSKRKEDAWKLIRFATSMEGAKIVSRYQRSVPALRAAGDEFVKHNPRVSARKFVEAFEYARMQPISMHWQMMNREMAPDWERFVYGQQSPEETVASLAEVMAKLFPDGLGAVQ